MRTINTDLIEKIILINDKFLKFAREYIFDWTNLTTTQFNILGEIILNKWLSVNELKDKLIVSAPALSQLLNRMEKSSLIERTLWKNDKRETNITPTKIWIELYEKINSKYIKIADEKFWILNENDKKSALKLFENIEKIIN